MSGGFRVARPPRRAAVTTIFENFKGCATSSLGAISAFLGAGFLATPVMLKEGSTRHWPSPFVFSNSYVASRPIIGRIAAAEVQFMNDDLTLGRLLGRREAFNIVAARCSAADAALLRELREKKLYLNHCKHWEEFCIQFLHMRKSNANRIIDLLDTYGPQYFEVAQLTRISPETYRAIAPAIQNGTLHTESEAIALIPENADKVAAAVAALRKKEPKPAPVEAPPVDPFAALDAHTRGLVDECTRLSSRSSDRPRLSNAIGALRLRLEIIQRTL
jgi:hypothetical protein